MVNPDRPSQLHKLRPFGCLAFNLVKVMDRNGKINPASSCGFFAGYGLTPDGTINGFRVMNFRTQRFTTKVNVRFNVQLPALRYALSALVNSPQQMLVGRTIEKRFSQGNFVGKITGFSTLDNVTLYDVSYSDGDAEQMDLLEVLRHIAPVQHDMTIQRPKMHKRLRQSTKHDRARLGKDLLPATPPTAVASSTGTTTTATTTTNTTITGTATNTPSDNIPTILPRRSTRNMSMPNRLTSNKPGTFTASNATPLPLKAHTLNKANAARVKPPTTRKRWKPKRSGRLTVLPLITLLVNAVTTAKSSTFAPNAVIDGIRLHRFTTSTPPMPNVPAHDIPSPISYDDAVHGPYAEYWRPAVQKEIDSLFHYKVWRLEPLPPDALVLPCKMVFRVKPDGRDPPGIDKFKCRYCGKGFLQKKGVHYIDAHAPVASAVGNRMVVAIATEMNWPLHGMDVGNAYLNALLEREVVLFVKPPPTIHVPKGYGLRLLKGLYGTMQGGNRWAAHKHEKLVGLGYSRNPSEPSIYHRSDEHGIVIMSVVVDDFQITAWPPAALVRAKSQLEETWDMTDLGPIRYFTGVQIDRNMTTRTTTMKQTACIETILSKYDMADAYGKQIPCTSAIYKQQLLDPVSPYDPIFGNNYRNIVGSLGYLRRTRPDICVALGVSAQYAKLGRHGPQHYRALRNIMRYLIPTKSHGLLFTSTYKDLARS